MYTEQTLKYELVGVCDFLSDETLKIMGYTYKNIVPHNVPILIYSKSGELNTPLFSEISPGKFKYIHPEIIKNIYKIKEAKEIYPELFI